MIVLEAGEPVRAANKVSYLERVRWRFALAVGAGGSAGAVAGCPLQRRTIQEERERPSASAAAFHASCSALVARTPITAVRNAMPCFTTFYALEERCTTYADPMVGTEWGSRV